MKTGQILSGAWENFRKICIHKDAPPVQVDEMKKAFYAGCTTVLTTMAAIGEQDLPDEVGAAILESLHIEVKVFAQNLPDNGKGGLTDQIIVVKH